MSLQTSKQNSEKEICLDEQIRTDSRTSIDEDEMNYKNESKQHYITSKTDKSKETKQISGQSDKQSCYFNEGEIFFQKANVRDFIGQDINDEEFIDGDQKFTYKFYMVRQDK